MATDLNLYARGITATHVGNPGSGTEGEANAMALDASRFTSFVVDGHSLAYVCGFGKRLTNGQFIKAGGIAINKDLGWVGNYQNASYNNIGILRSFLTQQGYNSNTTNGSSWLAISDYNAINDSDGADGWGQMMNYFARHQIDVLPYMWQDIQNGAFGYDGNEHYFHQFAGVMLLLSSPDQNLPQQMIDAIRTAFTNGVSLIVLQYGPNRGMPNFNAIFNALNIQTAGGNDYMVSTFKGKADALAAYGDHISWTNVPRLHIQESYTTSDTYHFINGQPSGDVGNVGGQGGAWHKFWTAASDYTDDVVLDTPIFYRDDCCVEEGDGFETIFDIASYPTKPDNWPALMATGEVSISWDNTNRLGFQGRSRIFSHVVGFGVDPAQRPGFTVINGQRITDVRSYSVYVIDKASLTLRTYRQFDIHADGDGSATGIAAAAQMAAYLNSLQSDVWVYVTMFDETSYNHTQGGLPAAMYRIGASRRVFGGGQFHYRSAYNCFGSPGVGEGNAIMELFKGDSDSDADSIFDVGYDFDELGNPYCTGARDPRDPDAVAFFGYGMSIKNNTKDATIDYYKIQKTWDADKTYGVRLDLTMRDNRFKKLDISARDSSVVSVTNPCQPIPLVQSHDWVHRVNRAGSNLVMYPFKDLCEYLVTTTDGSGQNELCNSHLMMNFDMFGSVGSGTIFNSAGASHKVFCGTNNGNINDPSSLYINTTEEGKVWHIYERPYNLIDREATRDTNDWQVHWKWSGVGSQGHNIKIDAGYEYIVFAYDRYGEIELAERHFFVPPEDYLPKWGSNFYCRDFSNSTTFTVDRSLLCNAYCERSSDNGTENGIMMIIRRPLFLTTGPDDRTGWECIFNNNGTVIPKGNNYGIPCVKNYQYMVLCPVGDGAYSSHHFNSWAGAFDAVWEGLFESDSCGRASWQADLQLMMRGGNSGGLTMDSFVSTFLGSPIGVFQVWRRPILCWEPSQIED